MTRTRILVLILLLPVLPAAATGQPPSCLPCAGWVVDDPLAAAALIAGDPLAEDEVLFVKWRATPGGQDAAAARALGAAGAIPWLVLDFQTAPPLLANLASLQEELRLLAELALAAGARAHLELGWSAGGQAAAAELAFLIKRAAVAISGAQPDAQVFAHLAAVEESALELLYAEEVAAYLDGVVLPPLADERLTATAAVLQKLDPGIVLATGPPVAPPAPADVLAEAARLAARGASVALFPLGETSSRWLAPLRRLAADFRGDLSVDPYSAPAGAVEAWSFVRGEDLSLRVVVRSPPGADAVRLEFPDPQLHEPALIDIDTGTPLPLYGLRTGSGFELEVEAPPEVMLLSLERMTAAELEGVAGVEERLTVEDVRQMPVEEILRRLQAFEDAQARRLRHFEAVNTVHLRFQVGTGAQSVDATFRGDYFERQGESYDWAWRDFLVNGVKWRGKSIPELPLLQPERAASMPVEITFTRDYRYRLRGTATVQGRDCWVVDFEPAAPVEEGTSLHQGTVWIDRELYARVQTRAVQLGLKGDVLSNEETITFSPLTADGGPAPWSATSYYLPVRLVGQQIWSILSATTIVEREMTLTEIEINGDDFEQRRQAVLDSELTMVRDTDNGFRYLTVDKESGERVLQEELDTSRRFLVGGILYDEARDFPLPLAGMNWLWFDWRDTGAQANVFFAGALFNVAVTDPSFLDSKFDLGFDVFGIALAGTDTLFRNGVEVPREDVDVLSPSVDLKIGRPFGSFFKLDLEYELEWLKFTRADDTAAEFVLPRDHFNHGFSLTGRYNRRGYRMRLGGSYNIRSEWREWGLPGNVDFDPDADTFTRWGASVGKTWHFPNFLKLGAELEYLNGGRLDRFSKYQFGLFSDVTVHGYQSDRVKAEEVLAAHLTYGFELGQLFRLDLVGDAAWATDRRSGLDQELLGGVGVAGTVVGPWQTVVNLDVGVAVAGPDSGFTAFLTVLKLFKR